KSVPGPGFSGIETPSAAVTCAAKSYNELIGKENSGMNTTATPSLFPNDDSDFTERVRLNQSNLRSALKDHYDFILCGSGSSGSVVARRLAENPDVDVLLVEAGGCDDVPEVRDAIRWPSNYASERNWGFLGEPSPHLNGRRMPFAMGKVLGGG